MAFDGYLTFAGDEVINVARTQAYLDAGYAPNGVSMEVCTPCDSLGDVVNDGKPYSSPIVDNAPWVENNNPDSWDFAGIIPLEITGLDGSTRTASVIDLPGDGSVAARARYGGRTVAVTALLVGKTGCSVQAGLSWLSAVLAGDCLSSCFGGELCYLTCCPGAVDEVPIPNSSIVEPIRFTGQEWTAVGGIWSPSSATFRPRLDVPDPYLVGPVVECQMGTSVYTWTVDVPSRGSSKVSVGAQSVDQRAVLARSATQVLRQGTYTLTFDAAAAGVVEDWRPVIWINGTPVQLAATWTHPRYSTTEECLRDTLRTYYDATTVDGPTVVEQIEFECGAYALKVEWTFNVGNPFAFGGETTLVEDMDIASTVPPTLAYGVTARSLGVVEANSCPDDVKALPDNWFDPCCATAVAPPTLPVIPDPCVTDPATYRRYVVTVPSTYVPGNDDGVMRLTVTNDTRPKKGVRLRIVPDPLERGYDAIEECDFCTEFSVNWIPPNAVLDIDGARKAVALTPPGGDPVSSAFQVRGRAGGPFEFPELQCGVGYVILLDVPERYEETCEDAYLIGESQGDLSFGLAVRSAAY